VVNIFDRHEVPEFAAPQGVLRSRMRNLKVRDMPHFARRAFEGFGINPAD